MIKQKQLKCKFCPDERMLADYMSKPVVGKRFYEFRCKLMNIPHQDSRSVLDIENKNVSKTNNNLTVKTVKDKNTLSDKFGDGPRMDARDSNNTIVTARTCKIKNTNQTSPNGISYKNKLMKDEKEKKENKNKQE